MNVLDLGSGAGDVTMLLAEMVGPSQTELYSVRESNRHQPT
jgi:ubiquinone/menaquinone biosynthesis C-methylase UbiE